MGWTRPLIQNRTAIAKAWAICTNWAITYVGEIDVVWNLRHKDWIQMMTTCLKNDALKALLAIDDG